METSPLPLFYDSHCHLLTLSQPNLYLFIQNFRKNFTEELVSQFSSPDYLISTNKATPLHYMNNLLAVMESSVGAILGMLEQDLRGKFGGKNRIDEENRLVFAGRNYRGLVMTPLLMDFNLKGNPGKTFYYPHPEKSTIDAADEVFRGIKSYEKEFPDGIIRVFPFLGINPQNYTLQETRRFLERHFALFSRSRTLSTGARSLIPRLPGLGEKAAKSLFAGIKVYPPLGFDPWPEDRPEEMEKVRLLYAFAEERGIPITTHCDDQGFRVIDVKKSMLYTSPERWEKVLDAYPGLYLNFGHFGMQYIRRFPRLRRSDRWLRKILDLFVRFPHVYADISYNGSKAAYYPRLIRQLDSPKTLSRTAILDRLLFGSDFNINLTRIRSYGDYIDLFENSGLTGEEKYRMASQNAEHFLYDR